VETEGQVCSDCGIGVCDNCQNQTILLYAQKPHAMKVDRLMGFGAYEDNCKSCLVYKPLGDSKICKECTIAQHTKNVCYDCLHNSCSNCGGKSLPINGSSQLCVKCEASSQWDTISSPDMRTMDRCKICKKMAGPVNDYGICKVCHEKEVNLCACVKCAAPMRRVSPGQLLCVECTVGCLSCGTALLTNFKDTKYCDTCSDAISQGLCTDCGRFDIALDAYGKCSRHTKLRHQLYDSGNERYFCVNCEKETNQERHLCDECSNQFTQCPNCHERDMHVNNFVCNTCYDNIVLEYE
jgi:hypothetical protein